MVRAWSTMMLTLVLSMFAYGAEAQTPLEDPCSSTGRIVATDPAGDASNPQLDILEVRMSEHFGGAYAARMVIRMRVDLLDTPYPAPAAWWNIFWNGPTKHGQTSLVMSTCGSQAPTFTYSFTDSDGSGSSGAPDTAWFSGDGEIVFVLSRDKIGNPLPGDTLRSIAGLSIQFAQVANVCVPGVQQGHDEAGPGAYVIGSCVLAAPVTMPIATLRVGPPVPNPATRNLRLALEVPQGLAGAQLDAGVFDVTGRRLRRLDERAVGAGRSQIEWDLRNDAGLRVQPGTYWVRISIAGQLSSRRVQVLR